MCLLSYFKIWLLSLLFGQDLFSFHSCPRSVVHNNSGYCKDRKENDRATERLRPELPNTVLLANSWRKGLPDSFGLAPVFAPKALATCPRGTNGTPGQILGKWNKWPLASRRWITATEQGASGAPRTCEEQGLLWIFSGTMRQLNEGLRVVRRPFLDP